MEEVKRQPKKSIRFFNDWEVRAVWDDENNCWWFSATDIVRAINNEPDYTKAETGGHSTRECHSRVQIRSPGRKVAYRRCA